MKRLNYLHPHRLAFSETHKSNEPIIQARKTKKLLTEKE